MQPADGGAFPGVTEGLQFVVPGFAEETCDLGGEFALAALGADDGGAQPVLGDEDVAVDSGDGMEDAQVRVEL